MTSTTRLSRVLLVILLTAHATGCSYPMKIVLFNNTGEAVVEESSMTHRVIEPGQFLETLYPYIGRNFTLALAAPACRYLYDFPPPPDRYLRMLQSDGIRGIVIAQIEPDMSIHLLPRVIAVVGNVTEFRALQQGGFPLHPVSRDCEPPVTG